MSTSHVYDVIIIGGGMVGSTLACALCQQEMNVLIIEAQPPCTHLCRSLPELQVSALNLASMNILKRLGIWQQLIKKRFCYFTQMRLWEELRHYQKPFFLPPFTQKSSRFNEVIFSHTSMNEEYLGCIIENNVLKASLHEHLNNCSHATLKTNSKIESMSSSTDNSKIITLHDHSSYSAPLIIGADGAHSMIRQWSFFRVKKKEYPQKALITTVEIEPPALKETWQAFLPTGPMAVLPLPMCNNRFYASLVWYHSPQKIDALMTLSKKKYLSALIEAFPKELPTIKTICQRGAFPLIQQSVNPYVIDHVALLGDAAHVIHPLAGQGVNLGFLDAASLADTIINAWKRGENYSLQKTLSVYEKNRKMDNYVMSWNIDMLYKIFSHQTMTKKWLRNLGLIAAGKTPIARYATHYISGLRGTVPPLAKKIDSSFELLP